MPNAGDSHENSNGLTTVILQEIKLSGNLKKFPRTTDGAAHDRGWLLTFGL